MTALDGVRIVSVEQYGAGPFATLHLADLGSDVVKIEDPGSGGDVGRSVPPYAAGGDSLFFQAFNRNKRSIALDLATPAGTAVFHDLVRVSDVVFSNLRGDVPGALGLRYDDLRHVNPAIICCSLSGFGMTGPRASEPGYDYVLQGMAGWMDLTGDPSGPPTKSGLSLVDFAGGLVAATSILAGLHSVRRTGVGLDCDVSLFDTALSMLTYVGTWALNEDYVPARTRHSAHPSLVPFQNFATADGWIVIACPKEKFWRRLVVTIDAAHLAGDERFSDFAARAAHRDELLAIIEPIVHARTSAEWLADLTAGGVPCGPVNSVAEALAEPQTAARGMIVSVDHPTRGTIRHLSTATRAGPRAEPTRAPGLGEHADAIATDLLGYSAEQIREARRHGAFGRPAPDN